MSYQSTHTGLQLDQAIDFMLEYETKVTEALNEISTAGDTQVERIERETDNLIMSVDGSQNFDDF